MAQDITLGDRVKDRISGFQGIAIARTTWLHNCTRIVVQPETLNKEGKPAEDLAFDEAQLEVIQPQVHVSTTAKPAQIETAGSGGPDRGDARHNRRETR